MDDDLDAYLDAALWTSDIEGGGPNFGASAKSHAKRELAKFYEAIAEPLMALRDMIEGGILPPLKPGILGHDFWLSRNGHGAGFFAREEAYGPTGKLLQEVARAFGEVAVFEGDDGELYFSQ